MRTMTIDGQTVSVGDTIAFDYIRTTRSARLNGATWTSRIGEVVDVHPNTDTITIEEKNGGSVQFRQFHAACMTNVLK